MSVEYIKISLAKWGMSQRRWLAYPLWHETLLIRKWLQDSPKKLTEQSFIPLNKALSYKEQSFTLLNNVMSYKDVFQEMGPIDVGVDSLQQDTSLDCKIEQPSVHST